MELYTDAKAKKLSNSVLANEFSLFKSACDDWEYDGLDNENYRAARNDYHTLRRELMRRLGGGEWSGENY